MKFIRVISHMAAIASVPFATVGVQSFRAAPDLNPTALLDVYHQGKRSNCGSVAMTKLILSRHGVSPSTGPFAKAPLQGGGFSLQLIDGTLVIVTPEELALATDNSKFIGSDNGAEVDAANLLYAAMAVRRAGKNDGRELDRKAYTRALNTLGSGGDLADADVLPSLLGFNGFIESVTAQESYEIFLVGSGRHIAFAVRQKYDEHGKSGGEDIALFNRWYDTPTMYRYALSAAGDQLIRQCSDGNSTWTPSNALWRSCTSSEVTNVDRK